MREISVARINPLTLALLDGSLGAVWGLALALVIFIQVTTFEGALTDSLLQGMLLGVGATAVGLLAVPLLYFVIGAVLGLIHALVFNGVTQTMGGLEMVSRRVEVPVAEVSPEPEPTAEHHEPATSPRAQPAMTFGERIPAPHERPELPKPR